MGKYKMRLKFVSAVWMAGLIGPALIGQTAPSQPQEQPKETAAKDSKDAKDLDVAKELLEMKHRIEQLESELKARDAKDAEAKASAPVAPGAQPAGTEHQNDLKTKLASFGGSPAVTAGEPVAPGTLDPAANAPIDATLAVAQDAQAPAQPAQPPAAVDLQTPFAYADYTWMLSNSRNHDAVLDGKYFSGEFRVDTNYIYDYNHPIDHTLIGTTEGERTGEFIIQALNIGGDFHAGNMQGRILTQFGAVSTAVPRNDSSYSQGQWELNNAYRYLSEMYAGYHLNVNHGLNFQVGDFLSFIGLFSYYSFDNWTYQPSYVSSNTPWFFTGFRMQWFPTNKLKIEPWFINGWQTYAKPNGRHGIGGQILWRPTPNTDFVFNTYTLGRDVIGNPNRSRYHIDDSQEYKYYENPKKLMHRAAFTLTEDIGCESGGGVVCKGGNAATPAQNFMGIMGYNRFWFDNDKFAFTLGGGVMRNPGRYLVLLPPINGANATTGSPYFSENPGDKFSAYDFQLSFDYMPSQWVTWRFEWTQRGANVPYFTGAGGITPQVSQGLYVNTGDPTQIIDGFTPDLRKQERRWIFSLMVKL